MALYDALGEEDLKNLDEHVSSVFDSMRRDKSTEYSRCIAYAPGATQEYEAALDGFLVAVADRQNHGMQVVVNESPNEKCGYLDVWKGQDSGHLFKISKFSGANIVMMDGTINEGTIYGLFSLTKRN
ncbi:MAG: hypothetical protein M3Q36_04220 [bacterium]|nr:hypothetical protein [bacterium]